MVIHFPGEIAALTAALLWAIASIVYARLGRQIQPLTLNWLKCGIAIALLLVTLLAQRHPWPNSDMGAVLLLAISGVLGIGLGDTFYFEALNDLGPRRALLMETLAPPLAALLAWVLLREQLSLNSCLGIGITIVGVTWVMGEQAGHALPTSTSTPPVNRRGLVFGGLAALSQAVGTVFSRMALTQTEISPLWSTLVRLVGGMVVLSLLLVSRSALPGSGSSKALELPARANLSQWTAIGIAAFLGTYLGIWLQQTALKHAPVGIAQTLLSTSPLFVLPITRLLGDPVKLRSVLGAIVAMVGIGLLFAGQ